MAKMTGRRLRYEKPVETSSGDATSIATLEKKESHISILEPKQQELVFALQNNYPNISYACVQVGLTRVDFEQWYNSDDSFKHAIDLIERNNLDPIEKALWDNAIIDSTDRRFLLQHRRKERFGQQPTVQVNALIVPPELAKAFREKQAKRNNLTPEEQALVIEG